VFVFSCYGGVQYLLHFPIFVVVKNRYVKHILTYFLQNGFYCILQSLFCKK